MSQAGHLGGNSGPHEHRAPQLTPASVRRGMSFEISILNRGKWANRGHSENVGVAPLLARQPPVVVVPGGELAVALMVTIKHGRALIIELDLKEATEPAGGTQKEKRTGVAPLMTGQPPVVVVPGGELAVVLRNQPRRVAKILSTSAAFACS